MSDSSGVIHIFRDGIGECNDQESVLHKEVAYGLQADKVTCGKCKRLIPHIVNREIAIIIQGFKT